MTPEYPGASAYIQAAGFGDRGGTPVDLIVVHVTDGGPSAINTANYFAGNARASAHFVVGQDGTVIQCVPIDKSAWHAHGANSHSIGIEHCAYTESEAMRAGGTVLPLTPVQLAASAELVRWLCDKFGIEPSLDTIKGHKAADALTDHDDCPEGVTDPDGNRGWPWDTYLAMIVPPTEGAQNASILQTLVGIPVAVAATVVGLLRGA